MNTNYQYQTRNYVFLLVIISCIFRFLLFHGGGSSREFPSVPLFLVSAIRVVDKGGLTHIARHQSPQLSLALTARMIFCSDHGTVLDKLDRL